MERFRHVFELTADCVFLADGDGRIVEANAAMRELTGCPSRNLARVRLSELIPSMDPATCAGRHPAAPADRPASKAEHSLRRTDGTLVPIELHVRTLSDGGIQGIARAIDAPGATDGAAGPPAAGRPARDPDERLRPPLESAQREMFDWDVSAGVLIYSPGVETLFGIVPGGTGGSYRALLRRVLPADRATIRAAMLASVATGADLRVQFRVAALDGSERWIEASGRTARGPAGRPSRVTGTLLDVTERVTAKSRVAKLAQSEKLRAIGQMASGVAHDLSQSLALIAGYTDLARETMLRLKLDIPQLAEALDITARAATDAGESATRLLEYSRGQPIGPDPPVDLSAVVRDVARLTAPRWRNAALTEGRLIALRVEVEGHDLLVQGWGSSLREALTNLVFNAVDALPRGGDIRLAARRRGAGILVEVGDSGVGMTDDVRARAFEPYFTTKGERGTGLGLPSVRHVVEQHGGTIEIRSAPGRGTTFSIALPAAGATPADAARPPAGVAPTTARLRILVVDDDPRLGHMLRTMLARHDVVAVTSGEDAVAALAAAPFDVVISDLGMGAGMSGWALAERVARDWPATRFVLATGWGATIDPEDARRRGVEAVIAKPFSVRRIWEILDAPAKASPANTSPSGPRA